MKNKIPLKDIEHVAILANIPLENRQLKKFSEQISEAIEFNVSHLNKIDTEKIKPTAHVLGATNRLRADEAEPGLSATEALKNAKETHNGFFKVKAVLKKE